MTQVANAFERLAHTPTANRSPNQTDDPSLDNGEFIEASFGWCISCKYSSVFFTSAKIACLCFVCFPVPKKVAGDWMLAPFFLAKCASCKALAQNPVTHTCWIWTHSAPQCIANNNLIGMLNAHTYSPKLVGPNPITLLVYYLSAPKYCTTMPWTERRRYETDWTQLLPLGWHVWRLYRSHALRDLPPTKKSWHDRRRYPNSSNIRNDLLNQDET